MDKGTVEKLRHMKWGKIMVKYFVKLLEKQETNKIMQSILERDSDIVTNLIRELDKPFIKVKECASKRLDFLLPSPIKNSKRKRYIIERIDETDIFNRDTRNIQVIPVY